MVVLGNPPYSGESANKGKWIMSLMEDYKKEPGGTEKLKERNPKWINDDYVKFLRFGQHLIEKNGEGILAFINPHGFLDNPTFRGMRWNLLKTYDKIYSVDLHGNTKKKEKAPDGSVDENVFDIQQGVSINVFIKTGKKKNESLGQFFHFDFFGTRAAKNELLAENGLNSIPFVEIPGVKPQYFFVPKDFELEGVYRQGFSLTDLFQANSVGVVTANDSILVADRESALLDRVKQGYGIEIDKTFTKAYAYRPFDNRFIYYLRDIIERPREAVMRHFYADGNLGLVTCRQLAVQDWSHIGIVDRIMDDCRLSNRTKERGYILPLYLYKDADAQQTLIHRTERVPNLSMGIVERIAAAIGLRFVAEKYHLAERKSSAFPVGVPRDERGSAAELRHSLDEVKVTDGEAELRSSATRRAAEESGPQDGDGTFAPIDLLDYIYAVRHSPTYREKYKEFLKIDFPRVPYPKDAETFWKLAALGAELREIHLLESPKVNEFITGFPVGGDNEVEKPRFVIGAASILLAENEQAGMLAAPVGRVYFNDTQHFSGVPETAWNFYIGGYQPAQKWLKDRKGRQLNFDDIQHYQKIIVALTETGRIMKEIENIEIHDP